MSNNTFTLFDTKYVWKGSDPFLKEVWLSKNDAVISLVEKRINEYIESLEDTADKARIVHLNVSKAAEDIAFMLALEPKQFLPIQTLIGKIANVIAASRNEKDVLSAYQVAGEMLFHFEDLLSIEITLKGHLRVKSLVSDEDLQIKYLYPLPLNEPVDINDPEVELKPLGRYRWDLVKTDALEKLNKTAFTILDIEENPIQEPSYRASQDAKEKYKKYLIRKQTKKSFEDKEVYFVWSQDYRGRMYSGGYFYNPQGNEYEKSIVTLAHKESLNEEGEYQLGLAFARAYGLDKETDKVKYDWFLQNKDRLYKINDWKEPYIAKKLLKAYDSDRTNVTVELDSTNSQLQMIAVLMGDRKTALTCNVINRNDGSVADAYKELADSMKAYLANKGLDIQLKRSHIKKSMMIFGYNASKNRIEAQLKRDLGELYVPEVLEAFYEGVEDISPASVQFKQLSNEVWDAYCKDKELIEWTMPDGFRVQYRPYDTYIVELDLYGHKVSVHVPLNKPTDNSAGLGVNIIHSVDAYVAREMIRRCDIAGFDIYSIHDGFNCHPNNAKQMHEIYNQILADINASNLLEDIYTQIVGSSLFKISSDIAKGEILNSNYSIS